MTDSELNEAVARKLGWTYHEDTKPVCWQVPESGTYLREPWDYCHSIEAAWEIVGNHDICIKNYRGVWNCVLTKLVDGRWVNAEVEADTVPMAICLAFLKLP